mgnify:CR=1 FL=1
MFKLLINFFLIIILTSCGGLSDAGKVLRNEKKATNDEFLIEKNEPLALPPNYNELPEPGIKKDSVNKENDKIKKILKTPDNPTENNKKSSSVESSIIEKIR